MPEAECSSVPAERPKDLLLGRGPRTQLHQQNPPLLGRARQGRLEGTNNLFSFKVTRSFMYQQVNQTDYCIYPMSECPHLWL